MATLATRGRGVLRTLLGAGPRAVSRYTGTLFAVFMVQTLVALACMFAISVVLSNAFSHLPLFDDAVDGDLVALVTCVRWAKQSFFAVGGIVLGALMFWQLAAWFLAGGLYGVLAKRPEGRGETARAFGASGAATYLAYARLALCSIPGWILVLFVLALCLNLVGKSMIYALTVPQLIVPLAIAILPALLLVHLFWTVIDYARIELTLHHHDRNPSALGAYLRALGFVASQPITLLHGAIGWLLFLAVTVAYAYLAAGHAMYGTLGAVTLFVARQGIGLLRMSIRLGILAGQVELGTTRDPPPRRVESKPEAA